MPFVRKDPVGASSGVVAPAMNLASGNAEARWLAARSLAGAPEAVSDLAAALAHEVDPRVHEAVLSSLALIGSPDAVQAIANEIRSDDASLRTAALDALRGIPDKVVLVLAELLGDPDPDVRLLACELARGQAPETATRRLCELLDVEQQANVCAAGVEVLAEMGTPAAAPSLRRCAARFASEPFLAFSIKVVLDRLDA
jgi:HEAT repeat protein